MDETLRKQIDAWTETDEHGRIVDMLGQISPDYRDSEATGLLARAYNNLGEYEKALELLDSIEEEEAGETEGAAEAAGAFPGTAGTFRGGLKMNTPELLLLATDMPDEVGEEREGEVTGRELAANAAADCMREPME